LFFNTPDTRHFCGCVGRQWLRRVVHSISIFAGTLEPSADMCALLPAIPDVAGSPSKASRRGITDSFRPRQGFFRVGTMRKSTGSTTEVGNVTIGSQKERTPIRTMVILVWQIVVQRLLDIASPYQALFRPMQPPQQFLASYDTGPLKTVAHMTHNRCRNPGWSEVECTAKPVEISDLCQLWRGHGSIGRAPLLFIGCATTGRGRGTCTPRSSCVKLIEFTAQPKAFMVQGEREQ
jgi:hypothetical protein